MPHEIKITRIRRRNKTRRAARRTKNLRETNGTTASFPLTGPIPALRYGVPCDPASIVIR